MKTLTKVAFHLLYVSGQAAEPCSSASLPIHRKGWTWSVKATFLRKGQFKKNKFVSGTNVLLCSLKMKITLLISMAKGNIINYFINRRLWRYHNHCFYFNKMLITLMDIFETMQYGHNFLIFQSLQLFKFHLSIHEVHTTITSSTPQRHPEKKFNYHPHFTYGKTKCRNHFLRTMNWEKSWSQN